MAYSMLAKNMFGTSTETTLVHEASQLTGPVYIYFWHIRCPLCPAKLSQLNSICKIKKFNVIAVTFEVDGNFANSLQAMDLTMEVIEEMNLQNINHFFMTKEQKEVIKKEFNIKTVPYLVKYNPTDLDFNTVAWSNVLSE